jgi:hypothetical protein
MHHVGFSESTRAANFAGEVNVLKHLGQTGVVAFKDSKGAI